jgi:hypothetical protein
LPGWLASITQVPAAVKDTVEPAIEHTAVAAALIVNETGRPEVAVDVTVYGASPTAALAGAVDVNVIVWLPLPTAK